MKTWLKILLSIIIVLIIIPLIPKIISSLVENNIPRLLGQLTALVIFLFLGWKVIASYTLLS